jgi:diguanylate cyclase (GGDEF)-like protein
LTGNQVLQSFAQAMRKFCREYDYVARMGGDEFVVIAPGLTREAAEERAATLDSLARQVGSDICGIDFLSVSTGLCFYPEDGADAEQLLTGADRKMYIVKEAHHRRAARSESPQDVVPQASSH